MIKFVLLIHLLTANYFYFTCYKQKTPFYGELSVLKFRTSEFQLFYYPATVFSIALNAMVESLSCLFLVLVAVVAAAVGGAAPFFDKEASIKFHPSLVLVSTASRRSQNIISDQ